MMKHTKGPWDVTSRLYGPFDASAIASAALTAIEAQGLAIVPVKPTKDMLDEGAYGSGEDSISVANGAWDYMVKAGKL